MTTWFRGLKLRFLIPTALAAIGLAVIVLVSVRSLADLQAAIHFQTEVGQKTELFAERFAGSIHAALRYSWSVFGAGIELEERKVYKALRDQAMQDAKANLEGLARLADPSLQETARAMSEEFTNFENEISMVNRHLDKDNESGDQIAKSFLASSLKESAAKMSSLGKTLTEKCSEAMKSSVQETTSIAQRSRQLMLGGGIGVFLLITAISVISAATASAKIEANVKGIDDGSNRLGLLSSNLRQSSDSLSNSSSGSAAALEQTVASLSVLLDLVKQNDQRVEEASNFTDESSQSAALGFTTIKSLESAMVDIATSAKQVGEVTDLIDDISFQTNLLALNASVEAARAGDQGRGFAVVAEAVRTLAGRSAEATKKISELIKVANQNVERGVSNVNESVRALEAITKSVEKVKGINTEIAAASREQTTGLNQISEALKSLDGSTQQNAAMSEEIASMSIEIEGVASKTKASVSELNRVIDPEAKSGQVILDDSTQISDNSFSRAA